MKILMLVNWKIEYCDTKPADKQSPDYKVKGEDYWFYRYFNDKPEVDVVDISSCPWLENFERNKMHFYIWQAIKAIPKLNQCDLIVSHGMPSAVVICLWRRFFKTKAKHVVFDIGSFASASETGFALKLMQFASKSIDGLIYHTSWQKKYYEKYFSWIVNMSRFIPFGTDLEYFHSSIKETVKKNIIICIGNNLTDWETLVNSYNKSKCNYDLYLIGGYDRRYEGYSNIHMIPRISIDELNEYINRAQFCVLPLEKVRFSFGQMRLLQQMAMEKCVIASNIYSLQDYIIDGITGVLYEPKDEDGLCDIINSLSEDIKKIEKIGKAAFNVCMKYFDEKDMAISIENYYKEVLRSENK